MVAFVYLLKLVNDHVAINTTYGFRVVSKHILSVLDTMLHYNVRLDRLLVLEPPGEKVVYPLIIVFRVLNVICDLFCESPLFILRFGQVLVYFGRVENPSVFGVGGHRAEINPDAVIILTRFFVFG